MVKFSVIIPTFRRKELATTCLQACIESARQLYSSPVEVIVTDDGDDFSLESDNKVNAPASVFFTKGPGKGPAANRNHAATLAQGDWLIFIDDDCIPDSNLLKVYAEAIKEHPAAGAFEGCILPDDWKKLKQDMAECPVNTTGNSFWSANIAIRADLFRQIGGFDEQFRIAAQEDQDIYLRLQRHTEVIFLENAIVTHPVRKARLWHKLKRLPATFSNWEYYYRKHHSESLAEQLRISWWHYQKQCIHAILRGHWRQSLLKQVSSWYAAYRSLKV